MATVGDQVNGALRLLGVLAEGETPSAEMSQDALTAFHQMQDSWSTERLSIFSTQDQTFTWPANTASRTLGATGTLVGTRPVLVDDSTYFVVDGVSYALTLVNEDEYNAICLKTTTSTYPQVMWVNMTMPDATLTVWPVPSSSFSIHIVSAVPLTQPATLATALSIPPGYLRAFRFNLAVEIAAEFGVEPSRTVLQIAKTSKRNIKRINNPQDLMSMPGAMIGRRGARFNIYNGLPQ